MKTWLIIGSLFAFSGILASSLSSHAIKDTLFLNASYDSFVLAQNLLIFHGLAIIVYAYLAEKLKLKLLNYATVGIAVGILFFSSSIFIKGLTGTFPLGFLTPVGGALMMLGWLLSVLSFVLFKRN